MNEHELDAVLTAFTGALLVGASITLLALQAGRHLGLVVQPRLFGKSEIPITYLGGPVLALTSGGIYLSMGWPQPQLFVLLLGGLAVLALGFLDDLFSARNGIHPMIRVAIETLIAAALWFAGIHAFSTGAPWIDAVVTVIFLVGAMNAFNLLDNMDGVAGMTATAAAFGIASLAMAAGQWPYAMLAAAVGGASVAFLFFNVVRPKAYLGDSGALFLGLILGGMALTMDAGFEPPGNFIAAVVIFAVPFTDTASRQLSRWFTGGSPFDILGSTDHLSHRLVALGFSPTEVARLHLVAGLYAGAAAGIAGSTDSLFPLFFALAAFSVTGLLFVGFSRHPSARIASGDLGPRAVQEIP